MGQKVNPVGLRLGVNRTWDSRWFADGEQYGKLLHQDLAVRAMLKKRLYQAGVSRIIIERPHKKCRVTIYAARPGVIIGKKGADIDKLRKDLSIMTEGEVHLKQIGMSPGAVLRVAFRIEHPDFEAFGDDPKFGRPCSCRWGEEREQTQRDEQRRLAGQSVMVHASPCVCPEYMESHRHHGEAN